MEDVVLRIPSADVAMVMQFANRMGWRIEKRSNVIDRFIESCRRNDTEALTAQEIQEEVNAVRYGR